MSSKKVLQYIWNKKLQIVFFFSFRLGHLTVTNQKYVNIKNEKKILWEIFCWAENSENCEEWVYRALIVLTKKWHTKEPRARHDNKSFVLWMRWFFLISTAAVSSNLNLKVCGREICFPHIYKIRMWSISVLDKKKITIKVCQSIFEI